MTGIPTGLMHGLSGHSYASMYGGAHVKKTGAEKEFGREARKIVALEHKAKLLRADAEARKKNLRLLAAAYGVNLALPKARIVKRT